MMKTYDINYEINPPYPHRIIEIKKEWTGEDIKLLMAANSGLTVTLEEMNMLRSGDSYGKSKTGDEREIPGHK